MHYPWWYIPTLTSPMLIAIVATLHVLVSHYAVGGGFFLAVETGYAYRTRNTAYLAYLKDHAWFFILVTVVFGAISGVGIWWTIGLASPLATQTLIHAFVFGWAMEYVFFILEIVSAFLFFYCWGRITQRTHLTLSWIYAGSAWMSLVLITGITAFMLNPGRWPQQQNFWVGFLNPQFVPQTFSRTGGSFLLAALYVYLHATFRTRDPALRDLVASRSARPALLGAVLIIIGGITWYLFLPDSSKAALASASALNILMLLLFAVTVVVFFMLYWGPYRNPGWLSPGFSILFFCFGLAAVTSGEFIREAVRKPYIVYNVVLGNQIYAKDVPKYRKAGLLESGVWTKAQVASWYPQVLDDGRISGPNLLSLPKEDRVALGRMIFQYHCNDCHSEVKGFSPVAHMIRGRSREMLATLVRHPEKAHFFMPPWCGTEEEAELLTDYLASIAPPSPPGMYFGNHHRDANASGTGR